jgi:ParB family chromosome partitioning protein
MVLEDRLSMGHGRALLGLEGVSQQKTFAEKIIQYDWSVRHVEKLIASATARKAKSEQPKRMDPNFKAAIEKLESSLGTRVRIVEKGKKGRIEIEYYSQEELQRLYEYLVRENSREAAD